jgi:hypothetical protein
MTATALVLLFVPLLPLLGFAAGRSSVKPRTGRDRRRPGYMEVSQRASGSANRRMVERVATYTACKPDGPQPAERVTPETLRSMSRTTAPTGSTSSTVSGPGDPGTAARKSFWSATMLFNSAGDAVGWAPNLDEAVPRCEREQGLNDLYTATELRAAEIPIRSGLQGAWPLGPNGEVA